MQNVGYNTIFLFYRRQHNSKKETLFKEIIIIEEEKWPSMLTSTIKRPSLQVNMANPQKSNLKVYLPVTRKKSH